MQAQQRGSEKTRTSGLAGGASADALLLVGCRESLLCSERLLIMRSKLRTKKQQPLIRKTPEKGVGSSPLECFEYSGPVAHIMHMPQQVH